MKHKNCIYVILVSLMMLVPAISSAGISTDLQRKLPHSETMENEVRNERFLQNFLRNRTQGEIHRYVPNATAVFPKAGLMRVGGKGSEVAIYGSLLGKYDSYNVPYGIYSFSSSTVSPVSEVKLGNLLNANGGGVLVGDRYYLVNYFNTGTGGISAFFYAYDAYTWEKLSSNRVDPTSVGTDLTYDPVGKKIYGCFINTPDGSTYNGYVLGTMSLEDGSVTPIRVLSSPLFAIAANSQGELFGIDKDGMLVNIDKTDGSYIYVGKTGLTPAYSQSMTFDQASGRLFWAAHTEVERALYEIDTNTGAASKIGDFPKGEEFGGLFIPGSGVTSSDAPAGVENLSVAYDPATVADMTISFKMPSTTASGKPLTGKVDYVVALNDEERAQDSAQPGAEISIPISNSEVGYFRIAVTVKNSAGEGPTARVREYIGKDIPAAVGNLVTSVDRNSITLSWTAPDKGVHGGYLDKSSITYRIVRYPDGKNMASDYTKTSFTDTPESASLSAYWYEVTPFAGDLEGEKATTNKILLGDAFTIPYKDSFERQADFDLFTVVDANKDGVTWQLDNGSAVCSYSADGSSNDWLITPPIHLDAQHVYKVKFNARSANSSWIEKIRVAFGSDRTVEGMVNEIFPVTKVASAKSVPFEKTFQVQAEGDYYFGFQSCSDAYQFNLFLDDIAIEQVSSVNAPAVISDLVLTSAAGGAKSVTVSLTVPSKTIKGDDLERADVTVLRGNTIVKQLKDQAKGTHISFEDAECSLGLNTYTAYASNDENGLETSASVFVGYDLPGSPTDIELKETDGGKAVLSWNAPEKGQNGGYVNKSALKYHILLNDNRTVVAMDVEGTSYEFTPAFDSRQAALFCIIYAVDEKGEMGYGESSNIVVFGKPYDLPFKESFANGGLAYDTWGIIEDDTESGTWEIAVSGIMPTALPYDNDGGLLTFVPQYAGDESYLYSGKIDLSKSVNPILEFQYYYLSGSKDKLIVEATTNGYEFVPIHTVDNTSICGETGWRKISIPLNSLKPNEYLRIAFKGISSNGLASIHVDAVAVRDLLEHNLQAVSVAVPSRMSLDTEYPIAVKVENVGSKSVSAGAYTVSLFRNGNKAASLKGKDLAPDEVAEFTFTEIPEISFGKEVSYYATVDYAGDENTANNTTAISYSELRLPDMPAPRNLAVKKSGSNAVLTWDAPEMGSTITITDDFEDYESFIIEGIGDWTLADVDQKGTAYFDASWKHRGEPQAWIVFNAKEIGADIDDYGYESEWIPFGGEQCLISFIAESGNTDDWLISPRLSGKKQTVSFYVKGLAGYPDSYEVLVSKSASAADRESFEKVEGVGGRASYEWKLVEVEIPEGTNYFAIRHTATTAGFALMVDDVTYQSSTNVELSLSGYNVWRDGKKLNEDLIAATTYSDPLAGQSGSIYNVTAVYTIGESAFSNDATIDAGVGNSNVDGVRVYSANGAIVVENAIGKRIDVFATDGKQIYCGEGSGKDVIPVADGIYMVKVGMSIHKVLVK